MLKYVKRGMYFIFLAVSSIQLSGCDDSPIQTKDIDIQGSVVDGFGEPVRNKMFFINSEAVYTDNQGSFTKNDVIPPYEVHIYDSVASTYYNLQDVNTSKFNFRYPSINGQYHPSSCDIRVTTEPGALGNSTGAYFIFSDGEYVNGSGKVSSSPIQVRLRGQQEVHGRVYLLGYKENTIEEIVSYEKYGSKEVTLTNGSLVNVEFDSSEISYNAGEAIISGSYSNYIGIGSVFLLLTVSSKYTPLYLSQSEIKYSPAATGFYFRVPTNLPINVSPLIYFSTQSGISSRIVTPGTNGDYNFENSPQLTAPQNGATNVNLNTTFSTGAEATDGFYSYIFFRNGEYCYILTQRSNVTLNALSRLGIQLQAGADFNWYVIKSGGYASLDEYLTDPYKLNYYRVNSEDRTFTAE